MNKKIIICLILFILLFLNGCSEFSNVEMREYCFKKGFIYVEEFSGGFKCYNIYHDYDVKLERAIESYKHNITNLINKGCNVSK